MTTAQPNPVELAKQGDVRAITFLINRSLQSEGVVARLILKDSCLKVMLEGHQIPDQKSLALSVHKSVESLEIALVKTLKVYGRQTNNMSLSWNQEFNLQEQSTSLVSSVETQVSSQFYNAQIDSQEQSNKIPEQNFQQTEIVTKDQILLECKGENGILILTEAKVIVRRRGGFLSPYKRERHTSLTPMS